MAEAAAPPPLDGPTSDALRARLGAQLSDALGGPIVQLQGGRTPVYRGPGGILRIAATAALERERDALDRLRAELPAAAAAAPTLLTSRALEAAAPSADRRAPRSESAWLETDLGARASDPLAALEAFGAAALEARAAPEPRQGPLRALLTELSPPGPVKVTPLLRALRAARDQGASPVIPLKQRALERALDQRLDVTFTRTWAHGGLTPARVLQGGLCRWRFSGPDRLLGEDLAPFIEGPVPLDLGLHALKYAWRYAPLRAAQLLLDLGLVQGPPPPLVQLRARAHPGLRPADLAAVLGCAPGDVDATSAARALGRARGLVIGGVPLEVESDPPVRPRADVSFRLPRGRDPRRLFSRWDEGPRMDPDARASLTPEREALRQARRLTADLTGAVVLDGFCGAGGNAIALARTPGVRRVIALDTSAERLAQARHNAALYGVEGKIDLRRADFFSPPADLPAVDACFLDPPWAAGEALVEQAWRVGRGRCGRGAIKLPRQHPVPTHEALELSLTPEGFPSFVTVYWGI